jgi:Fe-S cluster biogenesis protein NfuA
MIGELTTAAADALKVTVTAEPLDRKRCRFVVAQAVYPGRWAYFATAEQARGAPLAERLFTIEGVTAVLIAHDKVTLTRREQPEVPVLGAALRVVRALVGDRSGIAATWSALAAQVGSAIRAAELRKRIQRALDEQVNPVIAGHGGSVSILDVKDNVVYVRMSGGCQGCGLADMTLKNGVEAALLDAVPEVGEIVDLTDHRSGKTPYYRK